MRVPLALVFAARPREAQHDLLLAWAFALLVQVPPDALLACIGTDVDGQAVVDVHQPVHSAFGGSRGSAFFVTARLCGSDGPPPKSRGRACAIATTGALCSPALGEPGACPVVSGGVGETENRNAPNGTAALGFVCFRRGCDR